MSRRIIGWVIGRDGPEGDGNAKIREGIERSREFVRL